MPRSRTPRFAPAEISSDGADRALALARDAGIAVDRADVAELVARAGAAAPAVLPALVAAPGLAATLADEIAARGAIAPAQLPPAKRPASPADPSLVKSSLRRMRHAAFARTALRELYAHADVDRTAREWSHVAAACIAHALAAAESIAEGRNGAPVDDRGARVPLVVLGMGKLGGEELNLGSDIDICFFYGTDDGAAGTRTLNEHFSRVASLATDLLDDATGEGFAFRVDLRLRPEGARGPLANSLSSAERYYETWGRTWERAALLRAQASAGDLAFGAALLDALRPFVYRRSVNPGVAREMADMLARARRELLQHDARDLKLGRGGIREAEFFVQSLQLVWGGRHRALQGPNTLRAAAQLRALGLLSHRDAQAFGDAWALLRRVEHRVQVMAHYATHLLPEEPDRRVALARSLDYAAWDDLARDLERARGVVRDLFGTLFPPADGDDARPSSTLPAAPEAVLADLVASGAPRDAVAAQSRDALGVRDPDGAVDHLLRLARRADMPLGAVGRDRHPRLGPRLLAEVRDAPDPDRALSYLADLFSRLHAAERYAQMLADSPEKARGLVGLFGASDALSKTLLARPDLVDAVVVGGAGAPGVDEIPTLVSATVALATRDAPDDDPLEVAVGALRRVQREVVLQVGLADIAGVLTAGEVARRLTALAEAVVAASFAIAAREAAERFGTRGGAGGDPLAGVSVVALGSLAAGELGYGGDVDLIVLHDGLGETSGGRRAGVSMGEYVARLAQRAIVFLTTPHAEGPGYAVDTRLRPSGSQGTLVVTLDAFRRYHGLDGEAGPVRAASWERQALIRARAVAGDPEVCARAHALLERCAYEQGPPDVAELVRLRERMASELGPETRGEIALKYGRGGLVDVEFAAQALQMAHGGDPRVRTPTTRRALAALRDAGHLGRDAADVLLRGEKLLRRAQLASRLVSERSVLVPGTAAATTVARKLGYRERGGRGAEAGFLADLAFERDRVRRAFLEVMAGLSTR